MGLVSIGAGARCIQRWAFGAALRLQVLKLVLLAHRLMRLTVRSNLGTVPAVAVALAFAARAVVVVVGHCNLLSISVLVDELKVCAFCHPKQHGCAGLNWDEDGSDELKGSPKMDRWLETKPPSSVD